MVGLYDERLGRAYTPGTGDSLARESQVVTFPDGIYIHLIGGQATFYHRHGQQQSGELFELVAGERPRQTLVATQRSDVQHRLYVSIRIVLLGRRPAVDDVAHRKRVSLLLEVYPIALQHLPRRPVSVRHRLELHEALVRLVYPCTLRFVGRVTDVQGVVVA